MAHADLADVQRIQYFKSLTDEEALAVAGSLPVRKYAPRGLILVEGAPAEGFFLLRKGRARIFRTGSDGKEQSFRIVGEGDTFAEVPVFDRGPNPASVEALADCEAVLVPTDVFFGVMARHPEVAVTVLQHFARRLRAFTELIEQLSLQTVDSRLARYIFQLAREEGVTTPAGVVVPRSITQQDLASLVGSVREVVSRALRVMEDDEIIEIRRKEILVRDLEALRKRL